MSKNRMKDLERKVEIQSLAQEQLLESHNDLDARIQELKRLLWNHPDLEQLDIQDSEVFEAFNSYDH